MVLTAILRIATDLLVYGTSAACTLMLFDLEQMMWLRTALMLPPVLYLFMLWRQGLWGASYDRQVEKLKLASGLFGVCFFLSVFRIGDGGFTRILELLVPLVLIFYLLQLLLLRFLRQDAHVRAGRGFQAVNLALVLGIVMLGLLMMWSGAVRGTTHIFGWICIHLLYPVLQAVVWIFTFTIGWLIYGFLRIMAWIFRRQDVDLSPDSLMPEAPEEPFLPLESAERGLPPWLLWLLAAAVAALAIWLIYRLFRFLLDRSRLTAGRIDPHAERTRLQEPRPQSLRERVAEYFTPAGRIRRAYRHWLKFLLQTGGDSLSPASEDLVPGMSTASILQAASASMPDNIPDIEELTMLYRRARYEDQQTPVGDRDATRAETLGKQMRQQ